MRPLVLASSEASAEDVAAIASGLRPRLDYLAVAQALNADVLDTSVADGLPTWRRRVERALASDLTQAAMAWERRAECRAYLSASEKVGLPLALHGRGGPPHVLVAHNLTSGRKRALHRATGVLHRFVSIVCLSDTQAAYLRDEAGIPMSRIQRVWDNVDDQFFCPADGAGEGEYVLAVGRESRDYATLIEAARLVKFPVMIVASSLWSSRALSLGEGTLPANVTVRREFVSYPDLRALYAGARLVAVPLAPSQYAAGVNGVLEAMAMGRPSVVTQSPGLAEYLADGATNVTVPPGDPRALAEAMAALWDDAARRLALGQAARARVEADLGLDAYARRVAQIVRDAAAVSAEGLL